MEMFVPKLAWNFYFDHLDMPVDEVAEMSFEISKVLGVLCDQIGVANLPRKWALYKRLMTLDL